MKTADLISALAAETIHEPVRKIGWRFAAGAAAGGVIALGVVLLLFGVRPDLSRAIVATALKASFGLAAMMATTPLLLRLGRPNAGVGATAFAPGAFAAISVIAALAYLAFAHSMAPLGPVGAAPECLKRVPLLALPIALILSLVVRSFAPTRLTYAGAAIGAFSGGLAIVPYALFCPVDSVAYIATWYLGAILVCGALGALAGPRVLRWS